MRMYIFIAAVGAALLAEGQNVGAEAPRQKSGELKVGDAAPDFALKDIEGKRSVRLSQLKGKPVVLIFGSCT